MAVVFTSATLSLAALECFVHLDPADVPTDLVVIPADIPAEISRREIAADTLPPTWRRYPAPEELAGLGTAWVRARTTAVLVVPSAIVPQERNILLNPAHPDFGRIALGRPERSASTPGCGNDDDPNDFAPTGRYEDEEPNRFKTALNFFETADGTSSVWREHRGNMSRYLVLLDYYQRLFP